MNGYTRAFRFALTAAAVCAACLIALSLWDHYMYRPWTRDGRIRADVVKIAPDVSGLVERVCVRDNQRVKKGDVLMIIDRKRFELAVARAEARVRQAKTAMENARRDLARRRRVSDDAAPAEEKERVAALAETAAAKYDESVAALALAKLDLERAEVRSTVDGTVVNLNVFAGDYAPAGVMRMAVVDTGSFWIYGYFEETKLPALEVGDEADIRLMSGAAHLKGHIESIADGITDRDNPAGRELLSDVNPTFAWVRLAMRVPVRIRIDEVPAGVRLVAGMTCTIDVPAAKSRRKKDGRRTEERSRE